MTIFLRLMFNRAGTRFGRATWVYLAYILALLLLHLPENTTMWLGLTAPIILLFNRFDRSGPTIEEARARAKDKQEASLAYRFGTRFGSWIRRHFR